MTPFFVASFLKNFFMTCTVVVYLSKDMISKAFLTASRMRKIGPPIAGAAKDVPFFGSFQDSPGFLINGPTTLSSSAKNSTQSFSGEKLHRSPSQSTQIVS